jgi:mannosyltransferase
MSDRPSGDTRAGDGYVDSGFPDNTVPLRIITQPRREQPADPDPGAPGPARGRGRNEQRGTGMGRGVTMLPPALVTLGLGAYNLANTQVRQDESATWWAAHLSWTDLGRLLDNTDVVLAPYYVLMHLWVSLVGADPAPLRLPSLVAMAVTAGLLALLGRRMFDAPTGLVGGLVFAVLPVTTRYATDARPYAMSALAVVVAALLLYRALDHEGADRWGGYALGMLFTGLFHPVAATVVVAYFVLTVITERQRVGAWFAVTLVPVAPLLAVLVLARGQNHQDPQSGTGIDTLLHLPQDLLGSAKVAAAVGVLAVLGVLVGRKTGLALLVWVVLPPLALFGLRSYANLFTPSYFVFTLPALALLAGAGVCGLARALPGRDQAVPTRQLVAGLAAAVAVAVVSFPVLRPLSADPQTGQPDYESSASYMLGRRPGGHDAGPGVPASECRQPAERGVRRGVAGAGRHVHRAALFGTGGVLRGRQADLAGDHREHRHPVRRYDGGGGNVPPGQLQGDGRTGVRGRAAGGAAAPGIGEERGVGHVGEIDARPHR